MGCGCHAGCGCGMIRPHDPCDPDDRSDQPSNRMHICDKKHKNGCNQTKEWLLRHTNQKLHISLHLDYGFTLPMVLTGGVPYTMIVRCLPEALILPCVLESPLDVHQALPPIAIGDLLSQNHR